MITEGYRALRESAALIDLTGRGHILLTGEDRVRLAHAMCSNHIQALTSGTGCYAMFLSAQGRILADANVLCADDALILDTEPEAAAFLAGHIDKYIIADDCTVHDATASRVVGNRPPDAPTPAVRCRARGRSRAAPVSARCG